MVDFALERLIRPKRLYSKLSPGLLDQIMDMEDPAERIDGGFVSISTSEPLSKRRANYLKKLGVNVNRMVGVGEHVLTFHQTSVEDLLRLARRPWVQSIEISQELHMFTPRF